MKHRSIFLHDDWSPAAWRGQRRGLVVTWVVHTAIVLGMLAWSGGEPRAAAVGLGVIWGVFTALAAWRLWWIWARTFPPGCCEQCGYDMRASRERCPECGAPAEGRGRNGVVRPRREDPL